MNVSNLPLLDEADRIFLLYFDWMFSILPFSMIIGETIATFMLSDMFKYLKIFLDRAFDQVFPLFLVRQN